MIFNRRILSSLVIALLCPVACGQNPTSDHFDVSTSKTLPSDQNSSTVLLQPTLYSEFGTEGENPKIYDVASNDDFGIRRGYATIALTETQILSVEDCLIKDLDDLNQSQLSEVGYQILNLATNEVISNVQGTLELSSDPGCLSLVSTPFVESSLVEAFPELSALQGKSIAFSGSSPNGDFELFSSRLYISALYHFTADLKKSLQSGHTLLLAYDIGRWQLDLSNAVTQEDGSILINEHSNNDILRDFLNNLYLPSIVLTVDSNDNGVVDDVEYLNGISPSDYQLVNAK